MKAISWFLFFLCQSFFIRSKKYKIVSIDFVHNTLFGYIRSNLKSFIEENWAEVGEEVEELRKGTKKLNQEERKENLSQSFLFNKITFNK